MADRYVIGDSLVSLVGIWERIITAPEQLASEYEAIWSGQLTEGSRDHFNRIRAEFNAQPDPGRLLYLLTRCRSEAHV